MKEGGAERRGEAGKEGRGRKARKEQWVAQGFWDPKESSLQEPEGGFLYPAFQVSLAPTPDKLFP